MKALVNQSAMGRRPTAMTRLATPPPLLPDICVLWAHPHAAEGHDGGPWNFGVGTGMRPHFI